MILTTTSLIALFSTKGLKDFLIRLFIFRQGAFKNTSCGIKHLLIVHILNRSQSIKALRKDIPSIFNKEFYERKNIRSCFRITSEAMLVVAFPTSFAPMVKTGEYAFADHCLVSIDLRINVSSLLKQGFCFVIIN